MKHLKLFLVLVLMTALVVSLGVASKAKGVTPTLSGQTLGTPQGQRADQEPRNPRAVNRLAKFTNRQMQLSSAPVPTVMSITGPGMSGTYQIPGGNYMGYPLANIGTAVAILNAVGLAGDVVFELTAATYNELPIVFGGGYTGAGTYNVTVQPAAGVAVDIHFISTLADGKGFAFTGAKNVKIDGLNAGGASLKLDYNTPGTFCTNDPYAATIYVTGGSDQITVKNADILGHVDSTIWLNQTDGRAAIFVWRGASDPAGNSNIVIDSCTITHATYAIKVTTTSTSLTNGPVWYTHNKVGSAYGDPVCHGGLLDYVDGMHYDYNVIDGVVYLPYYWNVGGTEYDYTAYWGPGSGGFLNGFGQHSAGHFYGMGAGSTIAYNYVKDVNQHYNDPGWSYVVYGFVVRLSSSPIVSDNRITNITTDDLNGTMVGIRAENPVYHNSIHFTGTMLATQVSRCLQPSGAMLNNAASNDMTGGTAAGTLAVSGLPGSTSDHNALYSVGRFVGGYATLTAYLATGKDPNSVFAPVNFDPTMHIVAGPSSAENIGLGKVVTENDIDNEVRDTLAPDAGADEFPNTGSPVALDGMPTGIPSPLASGIPAGVATIPKVLVKNNSNQPIASFTLNLTTGDGYNQTVTSSLPSNGGGSISFPSWTPAAGTWTLTATITVPGDVNPGNDVISRPQVVVGALKILSDTVYTWNDGTAGGWAATTSTTEALTDWKLSNSFTKLGGPYNGTYSWVTEAPNNAATYTEGSNATTYGYAVNYPGPNLLTSPWLDLSSLPAGDLYVSFVHSIRVEPDWDMAWMEYTLNGVDWKELGVLNDPKGVNWYSESVYALALSGDGGDRGPDTATMKFSNYGLYGPGTANPTMPMPRFANTAEEAPAGWVPVVLQVTEANYPGLTHAPVVKFRYIAFSDAASNVVPGGWAFDNFGLATHFTPPAGDSIKGNVWADVNGNGIKDGGEADEVGLHVYFSYFGVLKDSTVTDASGNYGFKATLAGTYNVKVVKPDYAFTMPYGTSGIADVNFDGSTPIVQNFGVYQSTITGVKFEDLNNNGIKDGGEPLLAGWTIQAHKDSVTGPVIGSVVTTASGFTFHLPTGIFYITEVIDTTKYRQTAPLAPNYYRDSVDGVYSVGNQDFGNYIFGKVNVRLTIDQNGDGVKGPADVLALPFGSHEVFRFYKDGILVTTDTVGETVGLKTHDKLDVGTYSVAAISGPPAGWLRTLGADSIVLPMVSSGNLDAAWMDYLPQSVAGQVFEDMNGNGVKDAGDHGLMGWSITVTGNGGSTVVSDSGGNWMATGLLPDVVYHKINITPIAHWFNTVKPDSFLSRSGNNLTGKDFGEFHMISVSGIKYRDRNNNGAKEPNEEGLSGWSLTLTGQTPVQSASGGVFSFFDVPPGLDTLREVAQDGWIETEPTAGYYLVAPTSGTDITGLLFGNYKASDTLKYRTLTAAQLGATTEAKAAKKPLPKAGKPFLVKPNTANLLVGIVPIHLGYTLTGRVDINALKQTDVFGTFNAKGIQHSGVARGMDLTDKGKLMTKTTKKIPPTTKNDILIADAMALKINLIASSGAFFQTGLGALVYIEAGNPLAGLTLDQISDNCDTLMTNWGGVPYATYVLYDTVIAKINAAFSSASLDTTPGGGWLAAKLQFTGVKPVTDVPFLGAGKAVPKARYSAVQHETPAIPTVYNLSQNYPNPFNPTTSIDIDLPAASVVTLKVYNMLGQEVATLINNELMDEGTQTVEFDASAYASGIYFYRILAQNVADNSKPFTQVKKMMLLK